MTDRTYRRRRTGHRVAAPNVRPPQWNSVPVPYGLPIEELGERLKEPGPAAWAAMVALSANPNPRAIEILVQCARSTDWPFRRMAIESIAEHRLARTASSIIGAALRDPSPHVVRTACRAVANLRLAEAHDELALLLSSPAEATRQTAVRALSPLWRPGDFRPVLRLYRSDPSVAVRRDAAWTLRETVQPATWRELFSLWAEDDLPRHRVWACQLAALFDGEIVREELELLAGDWNGHVRKAASRALQG